MADDDKTKRRRLRRWFIPALPSIQTNQGLGVREQGRHFTEALQSQTRTCPFDGSELNLTTVFAQNRDGELIGNGERAFVCPQCEFTVPVTALIADIRQGLDMLKKAERDYFVFAIGMIVVFGVLSLTTGYLMTLIGGLIFALVLLVISMTYRYRHWQAVNMRLFEIRPPVMDWIKDDFMGR